MGITSICTNFSATFHLLVHGNCWVLCENAWSKATAIQHGTSVLATVLESTIFDFNVESGSFVLQVLAANVCHALTRWRVCA